MKPLLEKMERWLLYTKNITYLDEEYLDSRFQRYLRKITEKSRVAVTDTIENMYNIHIKTLARECVINELADSGEYNLKNILVIKNPYGYVPLSAMAIFSTDKPLSAKVWVESSEDILVKGELPPATNHRIPVFGLFADTVNKVHIVLSSGEKQVKHLRFDVQTEPLPEDMEKFAKVFLKKGAPAYRFYYMSGVDVWFPTVIDARGNVRYYIKKPSKNYGVFHLADGLFLHMDRGVLRPAFGVPHSTCAYETDLWGRTRRTFNVKNGMHHDVYEISPHGNLLIATSSLVKYCEDVVAEVDRVTGKIIKKVEMDDIITEPSVKDSADWAHMNTVSYQKQDNCVLVCLRNLHSVLKIDWATGKLIWILGDPFFWKGTTMESYVLKPENDDIKWFYQAHASYQMDRKPDDDPDVSRIMLYDNHYQSRRQTDNFDDDECSYGNVYFINEKTGTVRLHKRFVSEKSTVRSNAVFSREKDRFLLMSGCLDKKYKKMSALIYDYSYSNGQLQYLIGVKNKFYRAYPFEFNYNSLAEKISVDPVSFGELEYPEKIDKVDVSGAAEMPPKPENAIRMGKRDGKMKTRKQKEIEFERMMQGRSWDDLDHTERIARTSFRIFGNTLYMYGVDHIVEYLYIAGKKNTYVVDYTTTKQELLALFYNYGYYMTIGIDRLEKDRYHLYIQCLGNLYDTEKEFEINDQEDNDE